MTAVPISGPDARVFEHQRIWRLDFDVFQWAASALADSIADDPPDLVAGIARGGLPLARTLAGRLNVPMLEISARHYRSDEPYARGRGRVAIGPIDSSKAGDRPKLLVADDMCGSGATYRAVCSALETTLAPAGLRTVALCRNTGSTWTPDRWIWDTGDWVVFTTWNEPVEQPTEPLPWPADVRYGGDRS
jgi:hypoxanthine phosphoribosyltransferase